VENIHKAGAHADEARWCGEWISQGDYNAFVASNKAFDVEIAKLRDRLAKLQAAYQQAKSVVDNYDKNRQRLTDDRDKPGRTDRYRRDIDAQLKQLEAQRDLTKDFVKQAEQDGGALQEQLRDMIGKKFIEGFAGRLVLLQADARTELAVISVDRDRREKRPPPGKAASQPDNAAAPAAPGGSSTAKDDPAGSR
jgi:chromosome segregation ATPase